MTAEMIMVYETLHWKKIEKIALIHSKALESVLNTSS